MYYYEYNYSDNTGKEYYGSFYVDQFGRVIPCEHLPRQTSDWQGTFDFIKDLPEVKE